MVPLSVGARQGEPGGGGGGFSGDFERCVKEGSGDGISLHTGPIGGTSSLGTSRDKSGEALEGEHVSLYRGCRRGTWKLGLLH
jgi:hypothetical protein